MKKTLTAICLALLFATTLQVRAQINSFGDIVAWSGTGSNQSALVIQWNDGKSPAALAWGFHWNTGAAPTVDDMLLSTMEGNVGLFVRGDSVTQYGAVAFYGLGYSSNFGGTLAVTGAKDSDGNPTAVTFVNGFSDMNVSPNAVEAPRSSLDAAAANPADRYQEGWFDNGSWTLLFGTSGTSYSAGWREDWSETRLLANNGWYGFNFGALDPDTYLSLAPPPSTIYAAVPETSTLALLFLAAGILLYARKRFYAR